MQQYKFGDVVCHFRGGGQDKNGKLFVVIGIPYHGIHPDRYVVADMDHVGFIVHGGELVPDGRNTNVIKAMLFRERYKRTLEGTILEGGWLQQ